MASSYAWDERHMHICRANLIPFDEECFFYLFCCLFWVSHYLVLCLYSVSAFFSFFFSIIAIAIPFRGIDYIELCCIIELSKTRLFVLFKWFFFIPSTLSVSEIFVVVVVESADDDNQFGQSICRCHLFFVCEFVSVLVLNHFKCLEMLVVALHFAQSVWYTVRGGEGEGEVGGWYMP